MLWANSTITERDTILNKMALGLPLINEAEQFGVKEESLKRYARRHRSETRHNSNGRSNGHSNGHTPAPIFAIHPGAKIYNDFERLETEDIIIGGDTEIPDQSRGYLVRLLYSAMAHNIKTLVIAGDFIATDQAALSSWKQTWDVNAPTFGQAIDIMNNILEQLLQWFDKIIIIEGNHDIRIARVTEGGVHLGMLIRNPKIIYSRYEYLWLETSRGPVLISHPPQYSRMPVSLLQKMYATEPDDPTIVIGHCHQKQEGMSLDGKRQLFSIGTGRDPERTQYLSKSKTTHPRWNESYLMMKRGFFYPIGAVTTDWEEHLGELYKPYLAALGQEIT